ncbi:MAG: tetratricopeptide repeat protein [Pseudomonadota bacterium]
MSGEKTNENKIVASLVATLVVLLALLAGCDWSADRVDENTPGTPSTAELTGPTYVGAARCAACHATEFERWQNSDHDLAMQPASIDTVLGDFDDSTFSYAGIESRFFMRDGRFFVTTDGADGQLADFEIAYTFGVDPLQQYLIELPDGRLQALSISWDSRPAADGGQRWYHLYADEHIDYQDPLHWTGPQQNWNFMCAECHSTDVRKNYSVESDRFETSWSEIDIACEACHGPGSDHVDWANRDPSQRDQTEPSLLAFSGDGHTWVMDIASGIAARVPARTSVQEIETCARCHSRRSQLTEDYTHGKPLADTHRVSLLESGLYFADGQVREEVYVYGSFLQSKMFAAGVTCTDCHDAHSLELKADGNGVCAQCHLPTVFDTPTHHRHDAGSPGARCTNCHMPSRDFMTIDARRDHSFRIPRPDISTHTGAPNACTQCHSDRNAVWAEQVLAGWFGESGDNPNSDPEDNADDAAHYALTLHAGRRGALDAAAKLLSAAEDGNLPPIVRATAVSLLAESPTSSLEDVLSGTAEAQDPLLRTASATAASALPIAARVRVAAPLLRDPIKSVRTAATATLLQVPRSAFRQQQSDDFAQALDEWLEVQRLHADRPEAQLNLGQKLAADGDAVGAAEAYRRAIELMPTFAPAYVNMADLYRAASRESDVEAVLQRGLSASPDDPAIHHALGLSLVRQAKPTDAVVHLQNAHDLSPDNARYAFVLAIALNSAGDPTSALAVLQEAHDRRPNDLDVLRALTTISRDEGLDADAKRYVEVLLALVPDDASARQLAGSLGVR